MTGVEYWRLVLAPYARDGYRRGVLDDAEVVLSDDAGAEVHLPRPSAAWRTPQLPSSGPDESDPEVRRGLRYLMNVGKDRLELTV